MESFGKTIRNRRRLLKITQADLAELAGVSLRTIIKIERNQANPTMAALSKIAVVMGMKLTLKVKSVDDLNES